MMEPRGLLQPSRSPRGRCDAFFPVSNTTQHQGGGATSLLAERTASIVLRATPPGPRCSRGLLQAAGSLEFSGSVQMCWQPCRFPKSVCQHSLSSGRCGK